MKIKPLLLGILTLLIAACGNNPQTYISAKSSPIVNIESDIAEYIHVSAERESLTLENKSANNVGLAYKLYWYDKQGVTQTIDGKESLSWQNLWLLSQQKQKLTLVKPTNESVNYRIYLRALP